MVKDVVTVESDTTIEHALALMDTKAIGCLPVVQNDQMIGIVTRNDIGLYRKQ